MDAKQIFHSLDKRRRELGITHAELGQLAFGKSTDTSLQNIRRGSMPSFDRMRALADALQLEFYFGPKRAGDDSPTTGKLDWRGFAEDQLTIEGRKEALALGYEPLPYLEEAGGMEKLSQIAISRDWASGAGLDFDQLCVVRVLPGQEVGDLRADDRAIVDRRAGPAFDGRVFVFFNSVMGGAELAQIEQLAPGRLVGIRGRQAGQRVLELVRGARIIGPVVGSVRFPTTLTKG